MGSERSYLSARRLQSSSLARSSSEALEVGAGGRSTSIGARLEVASKWFFNIMVALNAVQLGACTHPEESTLHEATCGATEHVFVVAFVVETLCMVCTSQRWWRDGWNVFDFALAVIGVVDSWILRLLLPQSEADGLKVFKVLRILRIIKVLRVSHQSRIILEGLIGAVKGMVWVGLLFLAILYCAAVFGLIFFRDLVFDSPVLHFGSLPDALFTMFSLSILGEWLGVITPVVEEFWWGRIFFGVFIFTATFGILNLIIGVITERSSEVQRAYERELEQQEMRECDEVLQKLTQQIFSKRTSITKDHLSHMTSRNSTEQPDTRACDSEQLLSKIPLPPGWNLHDCFRMFDSDHSGTLTQDEFLSGMRRLLTGNLVERSFIVQGGIAQVSERVYLLEQKLDAKLEKHLERLEEQLRSICTASQTTDVGMGNLSNVGSGATTSDSQGAQVPKVPGEFTDFSGVRNLGVVDTSLPHQHLSACALDQLKDGLVGFPKIQAALVAMASLATELLRELPTSECAPQNIQAESRNAAYGRFREEWSGVRSSRRSSWSGKDVEVPRAWLDDLITPEVSELTEKRSVDEWDQSSQPSGKDVELPRTWLDDLITPEGSELT